MTTNDRWQTALHEAGHGVAAIVLHGQCRGLALYVDGGGLAAFDGLNGNPLAYAIAAGPAAERLAERIPMPTETPAELKLLTVDELESLPICATAPFLAAQMAREVRKGSDSDDVSLANWAIAGAASSPGSWAGKVAHAHRMAKMIVTRHTDAIVRVATKLLLTGSLSEAEIIEGIDQ